MIDNDVWQILLTFSGDTSETDISSYIVARSIKVTQNAGNDELKFQKTTVDFEINYNDVLLLKFFSNNLAQGIFTKCRVLKNGVQNFLGYLMPPDNIKLSNDRDTYSLQAVDPSCLLDRDLGSTISLANGWLYNPSTPAVSVITQILAQGIAPIVINDPNTAQGTYGVNFDLLTNHWVSGYRLEAGSNLLSGLTDFCYEHGFLISFDAFGVMNLFPWFNGANPTFTFDDFNTYSINENSLEISKKNNIVEDSLQVDSYTTSLVTDCPIGLNPVLTDNVYANCFAFSESVYVMPGVDSHHVTITLPESTSGGYTAVGWSNIRVHYYLSKDRLTLDYKTSHVLAYQFNPLVEKSYLWENVELWAVNGPPTFNDGFIDHIANFKISNGFQIDFDVVTNWTTAYYPAYANGAWGTIGEGAWALCDCYVQVSQSPILITGPLGIYKKYTCTSIEDSSIITLFAQNLKKVLIDYPYSVNLSSYSYVAPGTTIRYVTSGKRNLTGVGVVLSVKEDSKTKQYTYRIKQTTTLQTSCTPESTGGTVSNPDSNGTWELLQKTVDTSTGELIQGINANAMSEVSPTDSGLYLGSNIMGYYDGSEKDWTAFIDKNGNAAFDSAIVKGSFSVSQTVTKENVIQDGSLSSSNYSSTENKGWQLSELGTASFLQGIFSPSISNPSNPLVLFSGDYYANVVSKYFSVGRTIGSGSFTGFDGNVNSLFTVSGGSITYNNALSKFPGYCATSASTPACTVLTPASVLPSQSYIEFWMDFTASCTSPVKFFAMDNLSFWFFPGVTSSKFESSFTESFDDSGVYENPMIQIYYGSKLINSMDYNGGWYYFGLTFNAGMTYLCINSSYSYYANLSFSTRSYFFTIGLGVYIDCYYRLDGTTFSVATMQTNAQSTQEYGYLPTSRNAVVISPILKTPQLEGYILSNITATWTTLVKTINAGEMYQVTFNNSDSSATGMYYVKNYSGTFYFYRYPGDSAQTPTQLQQSGTTLQALGVSVGTSFNAIRLI